MEQVHKYAIEKHPRISQVDLQYGTAGFRAHFSLLDHVLYRVGLLACLRSMAKKASIGAMITASHNPYEDNGVKLIDPLGEMLAASWETYATRLVNVSDANLVVTLQNIVEQEAIDTEADANVAIAWDTRPSCASLAAALKDGIEALNGTVISYGLLTTPQLHHMVFCRNSPGQEGQATEQGYYKKLATAFTALRGQEYKRSNYIPVIVIDGANGVGAVKLRALLGYLDNPKLLSVTICNDGTVGKLNHMCGADYVKVEQKAPDGMTLQHGVRYASFDGDADRIVFYYVTPDGSFHLLDGDKMATLVAEFMKTLVQSAGLDLNLGLVQTAYANGSSTDYITRTLKVPVACVPTGVKHLHHKAQSFDIGVYFEANGHGTVVFSGQSVSRIQEAASNESLSADRRAAAKNLLYVVDVINQTVGDAISDLLLVESVLYAKGWSVEDWDSAYTDLPNRQLKVKVGDRNVIQTTDAERRVTTPPGLQDVIDSLVLKFPRGRSFVRPSGTEDVVRVYAEADTQSHADLLAQEVSIKVHEMAGGVGSVPSSAHL